MNRIDLIQISNEEPSTTSNTWLTKTLRRIGMSVQLVALWTVIGLGGCDLRSDPFQHDLTEQGRQIAETRCARCHAIDSLEKSPHPQAPPFYIAVLDYDIESLGLDFEAHMETGTDVMPAFNLTAEEQDALITYILTVEQEARGHLDE